MQLQVGQEVELIVHVDVTHKALHARLVKSIVKQSGRVSRSTGDRHSGIVYSLVETEEGIVAGIYGSVRVTCQSAPNGALVCKAVLVGGTLEVDVKLQVIVEERW